MNIPEKAVLAMTEQLGLTPDEIDEAHVQALEAAAPFIAAQALRDAADSYRAEWWGSKESMAIKSVRLGFSVSLKSRADRLEGK